MTLLVSVTFLLLNCLLSCSADFNATLKQYRDANFDSQATLFALIESRAQYNETNVIEHLLGENQRLDRLYQLKWINELISSPVFQANEVINADTKKRYADEYEKEKRLHESTPLDVETGILQEKLEKKWKVRAKLNAAEDAYLKSSKSLAKCVKKEENTPEKVNLASGEKQIRELKKAVNTQLYVIVEAFKQLSLIRNNAKSTLLKAKAQTASAKYTNEIDALVNKVVEVERQRFQYLQLLCPDERVKVVIDSLIAEVYTPTK
uniref:Uncharacterized protein n=1 Tax=Trichobilharzia regenti TaxID=157069 RepID=A0AA85K8U6_TRIRE|nr:unnamed protein product [Trichobilharzia regenti]